MRYSRRLILRSPAAALLLAMALTLFPAAQSDPVPGLAVGAAGAAFLDPASLEEAFGVPYRLQATTSIEESWQLACKAVIFDKITQLVLCLDGSEATTAYQSERPTAVDNLEKIGQLSPYMIQYGSRFSLDASTYPLDKADTVVDTLTRLKELCDAHKVRLTLIFLPLHTSRFDALDLAALTDYKHSLAAVYDLWDFSRSEISADVRYFYTRDCARTDVLDCMLDRIGGKTVPFDNFGMHLTAKDPVSRIEEFHRLPLPQSAAYTTEVPILLYHHITKEPRTRADLSPDTFRRHMEALKQAGYTAVTAADMIAYVEEGTPLPPKPIWITFDDGYTSNYTLAYPILKELGLKATIFAIGSSIGKETYKDTTHPITPHFTKAQAEEMIASGIIEVQSHTWDMHQSELYEAGAVRSTATPLHGESTADYRAALQKDLETYESTIGWDFYALAYPKGQYTRESEDLFHSLGIDLTVSTTTNRKNVLVKGLRQSLYALCRHDIPEGMSGAALLSLVKN